MIGHVPFITVLYTVNSCIVYRRTAVLIRKNFRSIDKKSSTILQHIVVKPIHSTNLVISPHIPINSHFIAHAFPSQLATDTLADEKVLLAAWRRYSYLYPVDDESIQSFRANSLSIHPLTRPPARPYADHTRRSTPLKTKQDPRSLTQAASKPVKATASPRGDLHLSPASRSPPLFPPRPPAHRLPSLGEDTIAGTDQKRSYAHRGRTQTPAETRADREGIRLRSPPLCGAADAPRCSACPLPWPEWGRTLGRGRPLSPSRPP